MRTPRIILLGDTAQASHYVGMAKELAWQTYKAGIRNKTYQGNGVSIRVENYFPSTKDQEFSLGRGWSKAFIEADEVADFLAVTWRPVGLMLTPQPGTGPQGYGFPKREPTVLNVDPETEAEYLTGGALINPPYGTFGVTRLHQVLINQYENNRYLDKREFINGLPTFRELLDQDKITSPIIPFPAINRRLRASIETEVDLDRFPGLQSYLQYWPLFFCPVTCEGEGSYWYDIYTDSENPKFWIDEPGLNHWLNPYRTEERDPLFKKPICYNPFISEPAWRQSIKNGVNNCQAKWRQFNVSSGNSYLLEELIDEPESGSWYCHWPEELLYDNDAYEMIFYLTNVYRSEAGLPPVHREIRGFTNTARMAVAENQRAEGLFHDNEDDFRQGYQTYLQRLLNATSNIDEGGENLEAGYSGGLGLKSGRLSAEGWRNSPEHYANMIFPDWTTDSTSHEIFGGVIGKATESVNGGVFDPPISGGFWSQVFNKRMYWVIAGSVNQQTNAGRVSFSCANSPIGEVYDEQDFFYCYQGRKLVNHPAIILNQGGYAVSTIGAALYYKESEIYIRLIIYVKFPSRLLLSFTRPLENEGCTNWAVESSYNLSGGFVQDICFFNYNGSQGIITTLHRSSGVASYYLPPDTNQINACVFNMKTIVVNNGVFSLGTEIIGPETSHGYTVDDYIIPDSDPVTIIRWVSAYEQSGSGFVNYHPFYKHTFNSEGLPVSSSLEYLKYTMEFYCSQSRSAFEEPVYEASFSCYDFLEFPSGYKVNICKQNVANAVGDTLVLVGECYTVVFFYIDPVYEDMVYARINFRGQGNAVYGAMTIYAYYDGNEVEIKSFDEILIDSLALKKPKIIGQWQIEPDVDLPNSSTYASNVINPAMTRGRDLAGRWYPLIDNGVSAEQSRCSNAPVYFVAPGKIKTGNHTADLFYFYGSYEACSTSTAGQTLNFNYPINIPITNKDVDGVMCNAARYKNRFVVQIEFTPNFTPPMWLFVSDQQYVIHANFPLDSEVGFAVTHIEPFGVV